MFIPVDLKGFEQRTGIDRRGFAGSWTEADRIVSLRDITTVLAVQAMRRDYLQLLLESVTLAGDPTVRPFKGKRIQTLRMDPNGVMVGQAFIERQKYMDLLERFPNVFKDFTMTKGIAKLTAQIVLGRTADGEVVLAHYVPPIVEQHGDQMVLLDGVHRNFLILRSGTTVETVLIRGVDAPFPATPQRWEVVKPVDAKPPVEERFFDLRQEFFRDVKSSGIDG